VVLRGRAAFISADTPTSVHPGMALYVAAGEEDRFIDIEEDLVLLVMFVPAYTGSRPPDI
jgi:mannose-6-phosphate isomerase-like protein (cupin superfamily)